MGTEEKDTQELPQIAICWFLYLIVWLKPGDIVIPAEIWLTLAFKEAPGMFLLT